MENTNKLSQEEVDDLRKSLLALDMDEADIEDFIEKAKKDKEESGSEDTIAEKAEGEKHEDGKKEPESKEGKEGVEKAVEDEDLEKSYDSLKMKKAEIEKSIEEMEEKMGKKKDAPKEMEKAIEDEIHTPEPIDIEKAFGERFADIEKSLTAKFEEQFTDLNEIVKGLQDDLSEAREELKKIGDTPLDTKAVITSATFFEKGVESDLGGETKILSISRNRDELLQGMNDLLSKSVDNDIKTTLENGILDFTVNKTPTGHGISALALLARKNNITLEQ